VATDQHTAVVRMLADRHQALTSSRTQAVCRLHVLLREMVPGGAPVRLSAERAGVILRGVRVDDLVALERKRLAREHLGDIRRLDRDIAGLKTRITVAVAASGTTLTELHGVGPITAALILGHVGDPARFRTRDQFASYNATAPIEASSGPRVRHRLNPRGNRTLNHAIHMIAVTQIRNDTPGRAYYLRRQAEGKTRKEAIRALKRRVSDAVWRQLQVDLANR
jgi:transposase